MENIRLSGWQMFTVTYFFTTGTTWIVLPGKLIADSQQYAWAVSLCAVLYGTAIALLWLCLNKYYPGKSIVEIAVEVGGRWAGGLVALFYVVFFVQIASWVTRNLGDFLHISLMPRTPITVFNVMILLVCAYAVAKGIESIAMVAELLTVYINAAFWLPFLIVLREWDWRNFQAPHQFHLWADLVQTKYALAFPFMETVAFMMLFPYVKNRLKTAFLLGITLGGITLAACVLITVGVLGVHRSSHLFYPIFIIFREMQFTRFLEHLEAVLSVNILLLVCLKLSLLFYCAVLAICQLFKIERRASVAYPLVWVISAYALFFNNVIENVEWIDRYLFGYYTLYAIFFPCLLILGAWIRRKRTLPLAGGMDR